MFINENCWQQSRPNKLRVVYVLNFFLSLKFMCVLLHDRMLSDSKAEVKAVIPSSYYAFEYSWYFPIIYLLIATIQNTRIPQKLFAYQRFGKYFIILCNKNSIKWRSHMYMCLCVCVYILQHICMYRLYIATCSYKTQEMS